MAIQFAWAIILCVGMMILPETPRFHIKKGKHEAAAKALARLRRLPVDHPGLIEELAEVRANRKLNTIPSCLHNSTLQTNGCGIEGETN